MRQYALPSKPIGDYPDQMELYLSVKNYIEDALSRFDDGFFGVCVGGVGGGYAVDFADFETLRTHAQALEKCVFLVKPIINYRSLGHVIIDLWDESLDEIDAECRKEMADPKWSAFDIECFYVFENWSEAYSWKEQEFEELLTTG